MRNVKLKNYLHLNFLVLIASFTAVLGELITIKAIPLVWFRLFIASVLMFVYVKFRKVKLKTSFKEIFKLSLAGIIIALHWITFFGAIDASNISVTLAMFSTATFFASVIEPIILKRAIIGYEILLGIFVVLGVFVITQSEMKYLIGIVLGVSSAFLSALFTVLNGGG